MSYEKTTWINGDIITADKMNNIENGIASAGKVMICNASFSSSAQNYVLDKTVQEIYDAMLAGTPVYIKCQYGVLGPSGSGDYISNLFLAPVIKIYAYSYVDNIRIIASRPMGVSDKSGKYYLSSPATLIFSATGLDEYPSKYANVYVPVANTTVNEAIG